MIYRVWKHHPNGWLGMGFLKHQQYNPGSLTYCWWNPGNPLTLIEVGVQVAPQRWSYFHPKPKTAPWKWCGPLSRKCLSVGAKQRQQDSNLSDHHDDQTNSRDVFMYMMYRYLSKYVYNVYILCRLALFRRFKKNTLSPFTEFMLISWCSIWV